MKVYFIPEDKWYKVADVNQDTYTLVNDDGQLFIATMEEITC